MTDKERIDWIENFRSNLYQKLVIEYTEDGFTCELYYSNGKPYSDFGEGKTLRDAIDDSMRKHEVYK